jgi:hypothetical protein
MQETRFQEVMQIQYLLVDGKATSSKFYDHFMTAVGRFLPTPAELQER